MLIDIEDYLESIGARNYLQHYGTPRRSGRYPWGSGGNETDSEYNYDKRNKTFLDHVADLKKSGMTEAEIARGLGMESSTQLRAAKSIAKNAQKQADISFAQALKDKNVSNVEIGRRMGRPESSVRALLEPGVKDRLDVLHTTANMLKDNVDTKGYVDIGSGVENQLGLARTKLDTAVAVLKEQGYEVHNVQVPQVGGAAGNKTLIKVLAPPGTTYRDIASNTAAIRQIQEHTEDGGRSYLGILPPLPVNPSRVAVRYREEGGDQADGVIYVRPGVDDVSIGSSRYAQVRIQVGDGHYLKGMAVYKDDLPKGVDLLFNTNKSDTGNKLDAMKGLKDDPDNPFGATVRQITKFDVDGKEQVVSAMNIVGSRMREGSGEEGSWDTWSKNLPSQFLSKQSTQLAKDQLAMTFEQRKNDLDEIMRLTNPSVKKKLLEAYADETDSAATHLKAAALPRQSTHVLMPVNEMKPGEIYAPNFNNGDRVALVRFPHAGPFEIPELTVNNRNPAAKSLLGPAKDAVGIHHSVAAKLSGADFDGDTVLVIPNNNRKVQSKPSLEGLKDFDPQRAYPPYDGMKAMDGGVWNAKTNKLEYAEGQRPSSRTKGVEMGSVSNLITDMTIKGASDAELARAVRHSMVVIDAEKHALNWRLSEEKNGIKALKEKYQGAKNAGAATLISRAGSKTTINARKKRPASEGGAIDPATGKKMWKDTDEHWIDKRTGKTQYRKIRVSKLGEADDAHTLSSGMPIERVYADHSNRLKALANEARKALVSTKSIPYSPSARVAYQNEVKSLDAKLNIALKNRPLERQAQILANKTVAIKREENPHMDADDLKKVKAQALIEARIRTGAAKQQIKISDSEWDAIQAGAIAPSKLDEILKNSDLDRVKTLATPKTQVLMTAAKTKQAQNMAASGYTQAEIAEALGVSVSTLKKSLSEGGA